MTNQIPYSGEKDEYEVLWHTYLYWARYAPKVKPPPTKKKPKLIIEDPKKRLKPDVDAARRIVVFSCFALEYRLKSVFEVLGVKYRKKDTLGPLLDIFWKKLRMVERRDKKGNCTPPPNWKSIEPKLRELIKLRNNVAHSKREDIIMFLSKYSDPLPYAKSLYNILVDSIEAINVGTGYDNRTESQRRGHYVRLKIKTKNIRSNKANSVDAKRRPAD